jgi:monothiol glutaredoxin
MFRIRFKEIININRVVLFMRGTPALPVCGLSGQIYFSLKKNKLEFETVDLLQDPELHYFLRKTNSPSRAPFLYVEGKFIGGYEELTAMLNEKKIHDLVGG